MTMGRRENPIASCDKALEALVRWLRDRREEAGLSYTELATRTADLARAGAVPTGCSADTLARAASGVVIPRLRTILAYAAACGANRREGERLWKRARYQQSLAARKKAEPVPHVRYARDFFELREALVDLYEKDGSRPYEELERDSGGVLAHATVGRLIRGKTGRPTRQFVIAFAGACGMKGVALSEWGQAWDRAEERRLGGSRAIRQQPAVVRVPSNNWMWISHCTECSEASLKPGVIPGDQPHVLSRRDREAAQSIRRLRQPAGVRDYIPQPARSGRRPAA
ncbi:helix-turn-helix transcriptional regulator [Streptomyces sp. NPDC005355]|uniref:helix-turn-helix domain-containing protein n=1 Tax=Streptomyces sp. NPDC005355 TaxID=3157038 RepID=UPI0033B0FBA5